MAKKIRGVGIFLIAVIIVAAFAAMSAVQMNSIGNVKKLSASPSSDNSVSFEWKKVAGADGYFIYKSISGADSFEKAAQVKDAKADSFTLDKLEQAQSYDFYVTAYKSRSNKIVESKEYQCLSSYTRPSKQAIKSLSSPDAGIISVKWEKNSKASGYQLQYVQGKNFEKAKSIDIKDVSAVEKNIEKLAQKKTYSVRVRSYFYSGKQLVAGEWSDIKSVAVAEKVVMASNINVNKPMIALTFDDGPGYNSASDKILDVLEKYNARATFFMVGTNAKAHPENLKRKIKLGCELGNHTYNHEHYGKNVTGEDIKKCSQAIYDACGQYPTAFRSTGGNTTKTILDQCKAQNLPLYYWSLDTQDWKSRNADKVYNAVMKNVEDGDIILMHDIYGSTAEAVERMVPKLIEQGYQLVTVTELVQAKTGKNPVAGQQYVTATEINNKTS